MHYYIPELVLVLIFKKKFKIYKSFSVFIFKQNLLVSKTDYYIKLELMFYMWLVYAYRNIFNENTSTNCFKSVYKCLYKRTHDYF